MGIFTDAGFTSGQEFMQYFTCFGLWGIIGAILATILFGFIGMFLLNLGSRFNAESHLNLFDQNANNVSSQLLVFCYSLHFIWH